MLKKIFVFLFLILISIYLVIAVTVLNGKPTEQTCSGMELVINDSIDYGFISKREVLRLLNNKKLSPIGKDISDINIRQLEDELKQHPLIGNAECYHTPGNRIGIEITQRIPILRVMAANGEHYYIGVFLVGADQEILGNMHSQYLQQSQGLFAGPQAKEYETSLWLTPTPSLN